MEEIKWVCKPFAELTVSELYAVIRLRNEVFIVEGFAGVFQDADNRDKHAVHLLGYVKNALRECDEENLAAYCRIFPPGVVYPSVAIGRVCCHSKHRRKGLGRCLMLQSFAEVAARWPQTEIEIGAQVYLRAFYESMGFVREGEVYIDGDKIDHIHMRRPPPELGSAGS